MSKAQIARRLGISRNDGEGPARDRRIVEATTSLADQARDAGWKIEDYLAARVSARRREQLKSAEESTTIPKVYVLTGSFRDAAGWRVFAPSGGRVCGPPGCGPGGPAGRGPADADRWVSGAGRGLVQNSGGKVRADMVHNRLLALGFTRSERRTRRAVAAVKSAYRLGQVRVHRPWVTEPGLWLPYDLGDGPVIDGVKTVLFCARLAWSRFRVALPLRDKTLPSVFATLDMTLRRLGGAPTQLLTDNEKTVTVKHDAAVPGA